MMNQYIAEKRKVLSALATYWERQEVPAAVAEGLMLPHDFARGRKRRKVNVIDVDLSDEDIDSFLPQIVAILKNFWLWLP